jgi:hypothetical protein
VGCEPNLTRFLDPHYMAWPSYDGIDSRFIWIPPSKGNNKTAYSTAWVLCANLFFVVS